jgi:hypothetical protein
MAEAIGIISNYWKYYLLSLIEGHTFKAILMQPGFAFNRNSHKVYADISPFEIAAVSGYIYGGIELTNPVVVQDDINDRGTLSFDNLPFVPSGADVSLSGTIVLDSTADVILVFASTGGTVVAIDGIGYILRNIQGRIT